MTHFWKTVISAAAIAVLCVSMVQADTESIGPNGINSAGLGLTGAGIVIGQVEIGRPGDTNVGDGAAKSNTTTDPAGVFEINGPGNPPDDNEVSNHAQEVAGVMISTDATEGVDPPNHTGPSLVNGIAPTGVAPGASLYSSAYVTPGTTYDDAILAMQFIANQPNMRAVNHSWGKDTVTPGDPMDGNSQMTLALDWSAREHNVLHLVAGNQGSTLPLKKLVPKDNFNGMTIGRSSKVGSVFRQVSSGNNYSRDAEGDRTSIDLIAPGDGIELTGLNDAHRITAGGTSFATPHVTGTVALLQEYGDAQIAAGSTNWTGLFEGKPTARRHEVMKAVLMNSADKIKDDGNFVLNGNTIPQGKLLGMDRTVLKQDGTSTWFDSDAYYDVVEDELDTDTPLDEEMGAGHLNAKRALQQFIPGEHDFNGTDGFTPPVGDVPLIGWDYGTITGTNFPFNKYVLDTPLVAGNFISITLAWDREVELTIDDGSFAINDTFEDGDLTNLDLYLIPSGETNIGEEIAISESSDSSVEHMLVEIPFDGDYDIWVFRNEQFAPAQDYGIAWQYGLAPDLPAPNLLGDFDNDNDVDGADFLTWQRNTTVGSLLDWQSEYGMTSVVVAATTVPEPTSLLLVFVGLCVPWT